MISFLFNGGAGARNVGGRGGVLGDGRLVGHVERVLSDVCAAVVEERIRALFEVGVRRSHLPRQGSWREWCSRCQECL